MPDYKKLKKESRELIEGIEDYIGREAEFDKKLDELLLKWEEKENNDERRDLFHTGRSSKEVAND